MSSDCVVEGCGRPAEELELRRIEGDRWDIKLARMGFVEISPPTPLAKASLCIDHRKWFVQAIRAKHKGASHETGDLVWYA